MPFAALAHTGERGYILLLPTGLYITGGALAVGLSFVVMAAIPSGTLSRLATGRWTLATLPPISRTATSVFALMCLALLVAAGFFGTRDPLDNPLPLTVWTLWWVGFTLAVALFGDLWTHFNPWRALSGLLRLGKKPHRYPERLGYWPAVVLLFAFAWFELVYPAPQDPFRLAVAVLAYCAITLAAMARYGEARWLEQGEAFSVFFRMVGWLSPVQIDTSRRLSVGLPCRALLRAGSLPASGIAFVIVALGSVSFDGLMRTFWWLGLAGANPLEHPGRSSLIAWNTFGLAAVPLLLAVAYAAAVRLGSRLAGTRDAGYGRYVVAIVPIAFGYHFAHYLPAFLVDSQHAIRALGASGLEVTASFLTNHDSVHAIWNAQVAGIVLAHVAAVFFAHAIALQKLDARTALLSQLPMTALMIGYTVFGLWLLSTPVAG